VTENSIVCDALFFDFMNLAAFAIDEPPAARVSALNAVAQ
jgi:hypothetical protein